MIWYCQDVYWSQKWNIREELYFKTTELLISDFKILMWASLSLFLEPSSIVSSFSIELSQQLWCFTDSTRRSEQCSGRYYVTCLPLVQFAQGIPPTNVFLCSFFRWIVICLTTVARITFIVHLNMSAVNMKWVLCTVMKKVHNSYSILSLATAFQ